MRISPEQPFMGPILARQISMEQSSAAPISQARTLLGQELFELILRKRIFRIVWFMAFQRGK